MALLIKAEELKGLISIEEAIAAVRAGFRDQGEKPAYSAPRIRIQLVLLLALFVAIFIVTARNPLLPARGPAAAVAPRSFLSRGLSKGLSTGALNGTVTAVDAVGVTVSDLDRSIEFFSKVLSFEKVSEVEVAGSEYERLQGVFGLRMRVARMKLGDEFIELTEYLTPRGRPIPVESRSNDRWFQHIAIITSDTGITGNTDIRTGDFRRLDLTLPPFNFPTPAIALRDLPGQIAGVWTRAEIAAALDNFARPS